MADTDFRQAVNNLFPDIDRELKEEIIQKVTGHMIQFIKEKAYEDNPNTLNKLLFKIYSDPDNIELHTQYQQLVQEKLNSLPEETQRKILHESDEELTRVMHQIYLAYENK